MGVKLGLYNIKGGAQTEGVLRTGCWEYVDQREMKWREIAENCIVNTYHVPR
jgi:hypothetical protein